VSVRRHRRQYHGVEELKACLREDARRSTSLIVIPAIQGLGWSGLRQSGLMGKSQRWRMDLASAHEGRLLHGGSLDVEVGEEIVERAWQPPGLVAEQREHWSRAHWTTVRATAIGDEGHSHDECV
jgi:hypothetical protein